MKELILATLVALALSFVAPGAVLAGGEDVVAERSWARASVGTSRPSAAYLTLRNTGGEVATVTGIAASIAKLAEIHRTSVNDRGVSTMAPAGEIIIAAGETVSLEPGGLHAMLMHLRTPMIKGESFLLTISFADGDKITVEVPILKFGARGPDG